jgi:hypothetical protein
MSTADAVMSHWQVSQAFMRMAKRSKKNEIKVAFLRAEQQIIQDLYENLTETQLSEKKKANKFSSSSIINLRERPAELARLAEYFPLTLLSVYSYGRAWNIKLFCDKCKQFVKLTDLRIYELCAKHHECVALHCVPKRDDFQLLLDPLSVVEHFRRIAMIRSEDDDRNGGDEGKLEHFFDRAMYDDVLHNMSTLSQLVQTRSITFEETDVPALPRREGLAILKKEDGIER